MEDLDAIVIDNGSWMCKAGFAGDDYPRSVFPPIVGKPKSDACLGRNCTKDTYVGDEARKPSEILTIKDPNKGGINWDEKEKVWHHIFYNELRVAPEEYCVLMTEAPLSQNADRERTAQIMFETFKTPGFYLALPEVLSLISTGRLTGISLDVGDTSSHAVPVYEGNPLIYAIKGMDLAGKELTKYMRKLLTEKGVLVANLSQLAVLEIKEKLGYVVNDFANEISTNTCEKSYELPDGQVITVGNEMFRCPEVLFQPSLIGNESSSIQALLYEAIMSCDVDIRHLLYDNIVPSGGSCRFPGLDRRLNMEMHALAPCGVKLTIVDTPDREFSAWIGGSILASMNFFPSMAVSKEEYDEYGSNIVRRKCF